MLTSRKVDKTHERWDEVLENIISDHERRSFNYGHGDRKRAEMWAAEEVDRGTADTM